MIDSVAPTGPSTARHPRIGRFTVAIFDLDGTLVDTMVGFADLAAEIMATHHGAARAVARQRYLETSGRPFVQQLELIHPGHAANWAASDEFERRKLAHARAIPMDGATRRGLERMRGLGLRLVVSSNTGQAVVDEFARRELFAFDLALGFSSALGLAKGEPHVARICRHFSVARSDLVFVGDSLHDGALAASCGVAFVGRLGTFRPEQFRALKPLAVVASLPELANLLGRVAR